MDDHPAVFTEEDEAHEEAKNRLFVWRIARQIRIDRRVAEDEVVQVMLQDRDGKVLFEGMVGSWTAHGSIGLAGRTPSTS